MQNSLSYSSKNCGKDINTEIVLEICNFYIKVIDDMCKLQSINFRDIRTSLFTIKNGSYKNTEIAIRIFVSFENKSNRLAYIFAYSFIHSTVIYDHFSDLLKFNSTMKKRITSMKELRLCILGGGPGFEAISVCKLISDLRKQRDENCRPLSLQITIIDVCEAWKNDAEFIISAAQNEICTKTSVKLDFQFVTADLTSKISGDVKKTLKNAHIITMFKFLSDIDESLHPTSEIHQMIQKIIKYMNVKGCLFFLDNAGGNRFYKADKMIDEHLNMSRIYKATHNCQILSAESVENICQSLQSTFRHLKCSGKTTISCSAWLKIDGIISADELSLRINAMSARQSVCGSESQKSQNSIDKAKKTKREKCVSDCRKMK